ncbi:ABC transporter permease [Kineococcus rubinsiae]|uniref:ABC transporter permease n=1 Tax=Kineococcus rubinsiae TaxID=2609562 RepID=UPI0027E3F53D|nr:ABC transporter permease [Kineococcus rubinsiae]
MSGSASLAARADGPPAPSALALDLTPAGGAAPWWRRTLRQGSFEARIALRNGEQLLLTLVLPVIVLVAAARTTSLDLGTGDRPSLALAGVLAVAVVSTAFTGQAIATGFDRRNGVLRLLATTPLGRSGLLAGKVLAVLLLVLVQVVVLGAVALAVGWHPEALRVLAAVPAVLLGVAAFTSLGLLLAGTVRAEGTLALANFVWVLLLAGGGLVLPSPIARVTDLLPSGALGGALRSALAGGTVAAGPLVVLAVWAAVATAACSRWFRWE